ncbi:MAG: S41 family peptidase [Desulfobacterales bacterium]|nr:S41 family peptidase [Desulfobacterales bacterium]
MLIRYDRMLRSALFFLAFACFLISVDGVNHPLNADDQTYKSLKLFTDVLEELEKNYVDDVDSPSLIENAIKGMVGNLDPHSSFMPPEAFGELRDETKGEFSGIGIVITIKDGILTVVSPIEGTPAFKAGIRAGDAIIRINGKLTKGMALWEAVKMMRGPRRETVVISVVRANEPETMEFSLERDLIPIESVRSVMLKPKYGYLRVTNFRMSTMDEITEHLSQMETESNGLNGLIMDLRDNPGGVLGQAVKLSDLFLEKGDIVSIQGRDERNEQVYSASDGENDRTYPVVVLINGGSASASEIVAGALQDHSRALILGTPSFGKGSVQTVRSLKGGFGIKYTVARYYTPNGRSIQGKGIEPDIEVEFEIIEKKEKKSSLFDRMVREKDLKNALKPEEDTSKEENRPIGHPRFSDADQLQQDSQVKRALDILISYGVFSRLNGS